jgi:probable rRNA maturation factor
MPAAQPAPRAARPPRLRLAVQCAVSPAALPPASALRRWARAALERDARVTLRFVGEREGRRLNATYRGRDYATNVLTFVYDDAAAFDGDIVLCAPVLRREAKAEGRTLRHHCAHLVVHGMLHLQGYDHERPRAARAMERRETAILAALGVPDPYAPAESLPPEGKARSAAGAPPSTARPRGA